MTQPVSYGMHADAGNCNSSQAEPEQITCVVQEAIGAQNYQHWFANRSRFEISNDKLNIFVPNPFISNWLLKRFRTNFNKAAAQLLGPSGSFELLVDEHLQIPESGKSATLPTVTVSAESEVPSESQVRRLSAAAHATTDNVQPLAVKPISRRRFRTFHSLVSGDCNELAVMASKQVAEAPGERFNPLYLHGPTGVGKTHLLEAIYSDIRRLHPRLNVVYLTSESFTNYFTQALESKTVPSFRQRFRNVDVLLVDNIEFLDSRKKATEEEFLHTIVQLLEHGGQLVVSGDRHPRLLTKHREELTTRLMSGLVARIELPSEDTRRRITATLALPMRQSFTEETLNYVARRCQKNVREIQGALNCLHGHYSLTKRRITVTRAREILGDMERECQRLVRISDVEKVICDAFGLNPSDLRSKSRRKAVACPRALAMYVARKLTRSAYREIGMYFGGRDHSTVVAAEKRVQKWVENESPLELPSSCRGRTISEVVREIEERLLALAS